MFNCCFKDVSSEKKSRTVHKNTRALVEEGEFKDALFTGLRIQRVDRRDTEAPNVVIELQREEEGQHLAQVAANIAFQQPLVEIGKHKSPFHLSCWQPDEGKKSRYLYASSRKIANGGSWRLTEGVCRSPRHKRLDGGEQNSPQSSNWTSVLWEFLLAVLHLLLTQSLFYVFSAV